MATSSGSGSLAAAPVEQQWGHGRAPVGPYGMGSRPSSGQSTPRGLDAIASMIQGLDAKLGPIQADMDKMCTAMTAQQLATQKLTQRIETQEYSTKWCWTNLDWRVKQIAMDLHGGLTNAADAAVTVRMGRLNAEFGTIRQEMKGFKQSMAKAPKGRGPDPQQMSMTEQIAEVKDIIEFRFFNKETLPETDDAAKEIIDALLANVMTDTAAAHAELDRKFTVPHDGGAQQLRLWLRLPSTSERNALIAKLTTREADGTWTSHIQHNGNSVEARRPDLRSRRYMMKKLVEEAAKFAGQNEIPKEQVKAQLPIHKENGTISYKGKVVVKWNFSTTRSRSGSRTLETDERRPKCPHGGWRGRDPRLAVLTGSSVSIACRKRRGAASNAIFHKLR